MEEKILTFDELLRRMRLDENTTPFVLWREYDLFGQRPYPVKIDLPCLFFCLRGEMRIEINLHPCRFDKRHILCFTTAPCAVRIAERSEDFRCIGILFSKNYWKQLLLRDHALNGIAARDRFIGITDEEREKLSKFHELLCLCADDTEVGPPLLGGLLLLIRKIQESRASTTPLPRGETIFYDFLDLVHRHYKHNRSVSFYAGMLSLTPRHLTTVVRQVSGKSASRWIEEYTVLEAQILLRNSKKTIKEIAYELDFNDPSLFSKYFSRITGLSPARYRHLD